MPVDARSIQSVFVALDRSARVDAISAPGVHAHSFNIARDLQPELFNVSLQSTKDALTRRCSLAPFKPSRR